MTSAENPRPIIVIGPERSGTSVITEMIVRWGAYPGESEHVRGPDQHNQNGYWEYTPIWDFLAELGVDWWDEGFQEGLAVKAQVPKYRAKAQALLARMEARGRPWVWKDPALSFFLPFWQEFWRDPVYVIAVRHPVDTALSWERFIIPADAVGTVSLVVNNLLRWQYIVGLVLRHVEAAPRTLFVSYDEVVSDPAAQALRLADALDGFCGTETNQGILRHMAGAVDPGLRHQHSTIPFAEALEATAEQKRLYGELLRKLQDSSSAVSLEEDAMPEGWREMVKDGEAMARRLTDGA